MFYSHQLLARKAPLGQIWRAATLHAKINRRNLNKLNIISICEEILNPSVPMALRLSGILMGGVVIVYERKVKLLYEDVNRLLVEINEAWKVKATRDPTVLPKGKTRAKFEAVTLPDDQLGDLGESEQHLQFSNSDTLMGIHRSAYTEMNLDNIDESYINHCQGEADLPHDHHQADIDNITMFDRFDSHQADAAPFNQFERFDIEGDYIEGDHESQDKFPSHTQTDLPNTFIPSPPPQDEFQNRKYQYFTYRLKTSYIHRLTYMGHGLFLMGNIGHIRISSIKRNRLKVLVADVIHEQHPEDRVNHQSDEDKALQRRTQRPSRKRARRGPAPIMDYEQTIIPGQMYQSWLQDTSDIVSRKGSERNRKHLGSMDSIKIARLMDLPPIAMVCDLFTNGNTDIYYPDPLLKQWMKFNQPVHDSPSGGTSPPHPPAQSSSSPPPPETNNYHDPTSAPFEDHNSGGGSESLVPPIENPVPHVNNNEMSIDNLSEELRHNLRRKGTSVTEDNVGTTADADVAVTPNSVTGDGLKSISSESGHEFVNSGRSKRKKLFSSSRHNSGSSLEPVAEDFAWTHPDPIYKLAELHENDMALDNEVLVETGPTQTQKVPIPDQQMEHITESLRLQLKTYFDTPGSTQTESLNELALGLDRKRAACLFYQTCVLATRDIIRVLQKQPYGNIIISRGVKM
ncbi:sister chromatid cohesion 1 protein 1 [Rutidosis leptorrhynchoides]|uniref:sister chromatid cohesion 1 protein 1 n=1 Tax=Rutidosis leptorrhynchoides TaxID=125765 RepID=UPI003A994DF5